MNEEEHWPTMSETASPTGSKITPRRIKALAATSAQTPRPQPIQPLGLRREKRAPDPLRHFSPRPHPVLERETAEAASVAKIARPARVLPHPASSHAGSQDLVAVDLSQTSEETDLQDMPPPLILTAEMAVVPHDDDVAALDALHESELRALAG